MSIETLSDITKIVVETDEKDPKTIAVITADDIDSAEGFRVRITPKYELKQEVTRMHHYMTFYEENGIKYAESWLQINFLSWCFCFWKIKKAIS